MKIAIVPVGYNRKKTLARLLGSICDAYYGSDRVDLIVSLDKSDYQKEIIKMVETYEWKYGKKSIRAFEEKQGLRKHILKCGDLTSKYDAVVILEDDLVVSKGYFEYVKQAVEYYKDDVHVAGISLYTHKTNPGNGRAFEATYNGYDVFLMKYAQSWGQCWTKRMWKDFRSWYNRNEDYSFENSDIPRYVARWNKQSWLKYYIAYCVECDKYYVYPFNSLTTNATEVGEHNSVQSVAYQVPMLEGVMERPYFFGKYNQLNKYDAYYERIFENENVLGVQGKYVVDLYGMKYDFDDFDFLISTNCLPYKVVKCIALQYRPQEANILMPEEGKGIYIYNLKEKRKIKKESANSVINYELKAISSKFTLLHGINGIKNKLKK